jgi:hypothetical protein
MKNLRALFDEEQITLFVEVHFEFMNELKSFSGPEVFSYFEVSITLDEHHNEGFLKLPC